MISVVVPNLNEAPFLRKFLISLERQSCQDFEVFVIDGGSTDGGLEILDEFHEKGMDLSYVVDKTRNIGYIRNLGAHYSTGDLLFHTSSDVMLDPWIIFEVKNHFVRDPGLISLTARTKPVSEKILCHLAYQGFDLLRWAFTKLPGSLRKYRPGGNFFVIRKWAFDKVGGFPEVCINEDGLLGQQIDQLLSAWRVKYDLSMCVHHHVKRFEERGSVKTILFYVYVFGNLFPMLKPLLRKIESHSAEIFKTRSDLRDFK